jgi:hypothetical protein
MLYFNELSGRFLRLEGCGQFALHPGARRRVFSLVYSFEVHPAFAEVAQTGPVPDPGRTGIPPDELLLYIRFSDDG